MTCVTLISDFGSRDASVAIAKGVLLQHNPNLNIVDINHDITPFQVKEAAYILGTSYSSFPVGTIHIVLVDIFSVTMPKLLLVEYNGQYLLTPDNGIVTLALQAVPKNVWLLKEMSKTETYINWLDFIGDFLLNANTISINEIKFPVWRLKDNQIILPELNSKGELLCDVIHIDRYENVVVNITRNQFESIKNGRNFVIRFKQVEEIYKIVTNYSEVRIGDKLCRFNSKGFLEICINKGKSASLFGLKTESNNNNIKIVFE